MSRSAVAGHLPLMRDGCESAKLRDFELEHDKLEFTLEVPLSEQVFSDASGPSPLLSLPFPATSADGSFRVAWAPDASDEVGLQLPARGQVFSRAQLRYEQPTAEPMLEWIRCSIEGTKWLYRLTFHPLPSSGALTFRFSSRFVDVTSAVGVVTVADLRSRII